MGDDSNPYKKQRLPNSCDELKCNSASMPGNVCTNCITAKTECMHVSALARKKRGPPKGTPRGRKTIQSLVKCILSTTKAYTIPDDPTMLRQILVDLASRIVELEEKLQEKERERESISNASPPPANAATTATSKNAPSIMKTYYTPASSPAHIEQEDPDGTKEGTVSSTAEMELVQSFMRQLVLDNQQDRALEVLRPSGVGNEPPRPIEVQRRDLFWKIHPFQRQLPLACPPLPLPSDYTFPEPQLLSSLVALYLDHVNPYYPILHRGIFEKSVAEGLHHTDVHFAGVLLVVCAIGARYSDDARVLEDYDGSGKIRMTAGWKWFRQVRLVRSSFLSPSLYELQLYCITPFFLQGSTTPEATWVILGVGFRFAQDLGIHRRKSETSSKPTVESELWNRAFWGLVLADAVMSTFLGRPRGMSTDDFDVPLPIECDDEYWPKAADGLGMATEGSQAHESFKQPPDKPSTMSYWIYFLRLLDVVGFAQRTIYAVRRTDMWTRMGMTRAEWNEKVVKELDEALAGWVDSVPEHLKWNPANPNSLFFTQSTILWMTYYWLQMLVHKPFMTLSSAAEQESESPLAFPSLSICVNAARAVVHILEAKQRRSDRERRQKANATGKMWVPEPGPGSFPTVTVAIISSAIILFSNAWRGIRMKTTPDAFLELADVYRCKEVLRRWEDISQVAGRFSDIVNELLQMCNLPPCLKGIKRLDRADLCEGAGGKSVADDRIADRPIAGSKRARASMGAATTTDENETGIGRGGDEGKDRGEEFGLVVDLGASDIDLNLQAHTNVDAHLPHTLSSDLQAAYPVIPDGGVGDLHSLSDTYEYLNPDFVLPISSTELGSLPLHETFNVYPHLNYGYDGLSVDMSMGFRANGFGAGAYDVVFGAGGDVGGGSGVLDPITAQRYLAESLSAAFGDVGPEAFFASLADDAQLQPQPQVELAPVAVPHTQSAPPHVQVQPPPLLLPLPQTQPSLRGQDAAYASANLISSTPSTHIHHSAFLDLGTSWGDWNFAE
ncbi:Gypsy retrotransposon integrase-like protein 1 [Marasmius sp. AFHP31]|nr:Gypsy retrotransposon integrase-like protein 1 [Marasmius sp. AFHP31]